MLSKVAERVYWLGRYVERVENTARLVNVYANVLLDLPRPAKLVWESLLAINGDNDIFLERYSRTEERNVIKFYLADRQNPTSIATSISAARENARTVREIVPANSWEAINDLSFYIREHVDEALTRRGRDAFLTHVVNASQFIIGGIDSTMSRDSAYHFLMLGRHLERADMTSRIVDVGMANVFPWVSWMHGDAEVELVAETSPYVSILWMSVLRSLSALQMYRRLVPERVRADEVVEFLLQDEAFPRSVAYCLRAVQTSLEDLPHNDLAEARALAALRHVRDIDVDAVLDKRGLFDVIDALQVEFNELHEVVRQTWFLPVGEMVPVEATPAATSNQAQAPGQQGSASKPVSDASNDKPQAARKRTPGKASKSRGKRAEAKS